MLQEHLGSGHEIVSAEQFLELDILKSETEFCAERIQENIKELANAQELMKMHYIEAEKEFKQKGQKLLAEIANQMIETEKRMREHYEAALSEAEQRMKTLAELEEACRATKEKLDNNGIEEFTHEDVEKSKEVVNEAINFVKDENFNQKYESSILIEEDYGDFLVVNHKRLISPQYRHLLQELKNQDIIKSNVVFDLMAKVDRAFYVPEELYMQAYHDSPKPIICNTTISAPHMHAHTLEHLKPFLHKGGKALDIGCGSGYMTACFAEQMGKGSKVYGVDHIQEIVNFSVSNVNKANSWLIRSGRLEILKKDGRKGLPEHGPYDVIHVGGAIDSVPPELEEQLKAGGRMWVPLGPPHAQAIFVIDKTEDGTMEKKMLFPVRYGSLTTPEDQLAIEF